mgnify:CR=1 FL=1
MRGTWVRMAGLAIVAFAIAAAPALAQPFSAGSSGVHGTFPPFPAGQTEIPADGRYLLWDMTTGLVRYCSAYDETNRPDTCTTEVGTAQIPGIPEGGLKTGVFEFVDVNVVPSPSIGIVVIHLVNNVWNAPLTILSQNSVRFTQAQLWADGRPGLGNSGPLIPTVSLPGGRGGPGGFSGGSGGIPSTVIVDGTSGFGPRGGAGSAVAACGLLDTQPQAGLSAEATPPGLGSIGGSGGGGGSSHPNCSFGRNQGGGGGGGGGSVIISADDLVSLVSAFLSVAGGNGGGSFCHCMQGGAGAGGTLRLTAPTIAGSPSLELSGGFSSFEGVAPGGILRIEGNTSTFNPFINGNSTASIVATPQPVIAQNLPTMRIVAVGGIAVGPNPAGVFEPVDVNFDVAPAGPVAVELAAANVPLGTEVKVRVTPQAGNATEVMSSALAGTVASSTASADVTVPPGYGTIIASATFACTSTLCAFLPPDRRNGAMVEVIASAGGVSRAFVVTADGKRIALDVAN